MGWKKGDKMCFNTNRSHSRASSAVWDAEGFMQIQVACVWTKNPPDDTTPPSRSYLRHPYRPVHRADEQFANLLNLFLKYPMGRRIGYYCCCQLLTVLFCLCPKIQEVNISFIVTVDHHHPASPPSPRWQDSYRVQTVELGRHPDAFHYRTDGICV